MFPAYYRSHSIPSTIPNIPRNHYRLPFIFVPFNAPSIVIKRFLKCLPVYCSCSQQASFDGGKIGGSVYRIRASPAMLSMGPCKIFLTSKFSYLLFCNPTYKTEIGTAYRWGTTNSKPPGPIIMRGQSEILISSQIIFSTVFFAGT